MSRLRKTRGRPFRHEGQAYYACKRGILRRLRLLGETHFLPRIDFICADLGFGRGVARTSRLAEVTNFLLGAGSRSWPTASSA